MKHIKSFSMLNESREDGLSIMDAIVNSPEGRDLCQIIGADPSQAKNWFDMKRTGRVHVRGAGAKTYIDRSSDGRYYYESLSNGKVYGTEYFDSVPALLRGLWKNLIGKWSTTLGIPKKNLMQWVDANIQPGKEMDLDQIRAEYINATGGVLPDVNEIKKSPLVKILGDVYFPSFRIVNGDAPNFIHLKFDAWNPFGLFDDPRFMGYTSVGVKTKISKKEPYLDTSGSQYQIILTRPESVVQDFDRIMTSLIRDRIRIVPTSVPDQQGALTGSILSIIAGDESGEGGLRDLVEILSELRGTDPIMFSKAIAGMDKAGVLPEIVQKFKESDPRIIRGGRMLSGLGIE